MTAHSNVFVDSAREIVLVRNWLSNFNAVGMKKQGFLNKYMGHNHEAL